MICKNRLIMALAVGFALISVQAEAALTRVGNKIGLKNIPITLPLDTEMRRHGVPEQCRIEAHKVLGKYIVYGFHDKAELKPKLDIVCDFTPTPQANTDKDAKGFNNKKLGQTGVAGGLSYIRFRNADGKDIERFMYHKPEITEVLECRRNGACIKLTDGGRSTVLDNTQGPITEYIPPSEKKSDRLSSGGIFASITPAKKFADQSIVKVAFENLVQGGGSLTSRSGSRSSPGGVGSTDHKGIDIGASCGTPIKSFADGVVISNRTQITRKPNGKTGGAGHYVRIRHADGTITEYFHMESKSPIQEGALVKAGDVIGKVGTTGGSTGCHLHFGAFRQDGVVPTYLDPLTMKVPSGTVTALSPEDLAALGTQMAAMDKALETFGNGGAAGDDIVESFYCITGVSPGGVNCGESNSMTKGLTPTIKVEEEAEGEHDHDDHGH